MNILISNFVYRANSGTEMFTRDLAVSFHSKGHKVAIYSPNLGPLAERTAASGIEVVHRPADISFVPDIIHAHHQPSLVNVLRSYGSVPAVFVVHDATSLIDLPLDFPRVVRYVGVDARCRAYIERNSNIPSHRIRVIYNAVDLNRFQPRLPLPKKPARALIFSNYADVDTYLNPVLAACGKLGIPADVVGSGVHKSVDNPESILPQYDLVFAKARCALEAMAVGASVILCDFGGLGPMVRRHDVAALRHMNFGGGTLTMPIDPDAIVKRIQDYDASDAAEVSRWIRANADLEGAVTQWLSLYHEAIAEGCKPDGRSERRFLAKRARAWMWYSAAFQISTVMKGTRRLPFIGEQIYRMLRRVWILRRAWRALR